MCIAIYAPIGKKIERDILKNCYTVNSDGCGFAVANIEEDKVEIFKTMNFNEFCDKYYEAFDKFQDSPFLIHFRIRTSGTTDEFNCHPFAVNDKQAFIHNGVIQGLPDCPEKKRNDTQMFNDLILKLLPEGWELNEGIQRLVEDFISFSKICVLNSDGTVILFNEKKGEWHDGIWWSNSSYKPRVTYEYTPRHSVIGAHRSNVDSNIFGLKADIINRHTTSHGNVDYFRNTGVCVCDMCGEDEKLHLSKSIFINNTNLDVCRDCVRILNATKNLYYDMYDDWDSSSSCGSNRSLLVQ